MTPRLASRVGAIEPFWVMEMAKTAAALAGQPEYDPARGGEPMLYLNIGEPDFTAAPGVVAAAESCLRAGRTSYTQATGLPALRRAISRWYRHRWHLDIDPQRIVVTAGASAALQLVCLALFEAGDEVLMPDPCYPCNRHFVTAAGAQARLLPAGPAQRFQLDASSVRGAWTSATRGVLLASPSNPTGTSIDPAQMREIVEIVRARHGVTVIDEIYLGLSYDDRFGRSALELGEDIISVNSFSKYFAMTGWRLGWLVLPPALVAPLEKLAQNLFICPSTLAQHAATACFETAALELFEQRRGEFHRRRDRVVRGLEDLGLPVPVVPDGAFYAWADCSAYAADSWEFCHQRLRDAHVVLTPGRDFGPSGARRHFRLSYASAMPTLDAAFQRLGKICGPRSGSA